MKEKRSLELIVRCCAVFNDDRRGGCGWEILKTISRFDSYGHDSEPRMSLFSWTPLATASSPFIGSCAPPITGEASALSLSDSHSQILQTVTQQNVSHALMPWTLVFIGLCINLFLLLMWLEDPRPILLDHLTSFSTSYDHGNQHHFTGSSSMEANTILLDHLPQATSMEADTILPDHFPQATSMEANTILLDHLPQATSMEADTILPDHFPQATSMEANIILLIIFHKLRAWKPTPFYWIIFHKLRAWKPTSFY
ncbi:hypothetical protein POTOM_056493 [Populus tomentosa]|uniref:Uncharacterized protein n=1 Tax=Populus tomentosa TaxID=118781 RepID=A0A8X8C668_POPTO|nr:hypothetical protein POTOM_056493 [Populus tomentosa]